MYQQVEIGIISSYATIAGIIDATTTSILNSLGGVNFQVVGTATSTNPLIGFLQNLFSQGFSFLIYTFTTLWPFWLFLGILAIIIGIGFAMMHLRR